jgi:CAAX protease family protein
MIKSRNPWLVPLWAYGIFIVSQMVLYPHFWISTRVTEATMDEMGSGRFVSPETILSQGAAGLILGIPLMFVLVRFLWRRDYRWVGLRFEPRAFLDGLVLGLGMAFCVVAILFFLGIAKVTEGPGRFPSQELVVVLVGTLAWILFKSLIEEVIFRGMVAREFALRWGWPWATVASGVFFGMSHMVGLIPVMTPVLAVGLLVASQASNALFVLLFLKGKSLALPYGCHFGWNFAVAGLIGTTMSGTERNFGLFTVELDGPGWLTGGEFGVEMSVVAILAFLLVTATAWKITYRGKPGLLHSRRSSAD